MKMLLLLSLIHAFVIISLCSSSCPVHQEDVAIIKIIVEDHIISDCKVLAGLAGIFFDDQQKPPNSVRVVYKLRIPYDIGCGSACPCWKEYCNKDATGASSDCEPGYCCIEKVFLWGRIPTYVQDNIFRHLTMCNLVVGGIKERVVTIPLNISKISTAGHTDDTTADQLGTPLQTTDTDTCSAAEATIPCSWCHHKGSSPITGTVLHAEHFLDTLFSVSQSITPLDRALLSVTAKLQGYAAKLERVDWLIYDSNLAFGFSAPYTMTPDSLTRLVLFILYFVSFQLIIFMLTYKYRYRLYNNVCQYTKKSSINMALFWSFILTTILAFACILVIAMIAGGICMSILQIILLVVSLAFGIPHSLVVCFKMKKTSATLINTQRTSCCYCLSSIISSVMFIYIYMLPHILLFWSINFVVSFIAKPFSYLLLFVYFCTSSVFIWVANAIGLHLMFPLFPCNGRAEGLGCRRRVFAIFLLLACNCLNFSTWGFVQVYFYDRRAQATSFMAVLPGATFTILGWYLSGDLVKLFDMLGTTLPSEKSTSAPALLDDTSETADQDDIQGCNVLNESYHAFNRLSSVSVDEDSIASLEQTRKHPGELPPRKTYRCSRLEKVVGVIKQPTSLMTLSSFPDDENSQ